MTERRPLPGMPVPEQARTMPWSPDPDRLRGWVAVVACATRGAGRGIAAALGKPAPPWSAPARGVQGYIDLAARLLAWLGDELDATRAEPVVRGLEGLHEEPDRVVAIVDDDRNGFDVQPTRQARPSASVLLRNGIRSRDERSGMCPDEQVKDSER
jgi:hypothetical protein